MATGSATGSQATSEQSGSARPCFVTAGLVPAIHVLLSVVRERRGYAGIRAFISVFDGLCPRMKERVDVGQSHHLRPRARRVARRLVYARVAALLRARGHTVFTPTLTGRGERAHLLSGAINLSTHIEDVLGVFRCERLTDVVLAGHSYGGMVITGVADRIAERIEALAYLDAFVPRGRPVAVRHQHPGQYAALSRQRRREPGASASRRRPAPISA